jgi:hypothetical protein
MAEKEIKSHSESTVCIVCGDSLNRMSEGIVAKCDYCGKEGRVSHECRSMHIICDDCIAMPIIDYVKKICLSHAGADPISLAVEIMNSPMIKMQGVEHHFIVPAVMLTCTYNLFGAPIDLDQALEIAEHRAQCETPDECSFHAGNCGAAKGAGIFLSMYLDRDPQSEDMWSLTNSLTHAALKKIADYPGPKCCKRDTYLTIQAVVEFLKEKFNLDIPIVEAKCTFSLRNPTCGREECLFFNVANMLV